MRKSNFALRLQPSVMTDLRAIASEQEVTLNQFINVAVAEKIERLRAEAYWRERAARADLPTALKILARSGVGNPPRPDDRIIAPRRRKPGLKKTTRRAVK